MSKLVRKPVELVDGVKFSLSGGIAEVVGKKGKMQMQVHESISIKQENSALHVSLKDANLVKNCKYKALLGTAAVGLRNLIKGVSVGFERKLTLIGVGYKAQMSGNNLLLSLGYSHPINYEVMEGVEVVCQSPTEIIIKSMSNMDAGKVASDIRAFRPVEPYQGKGVRYTDEVVFRKETKKK